jgi:NADPH:quinone reductase-like Zn-dependent oxidoreductase
MKAKLMNAMMAKGYGNFNVLKMSQVAIPLPKENEVLIKVYASSATRADTMMLSGKPYFGRLFTGLKKPKHSIPGTGFAGEVVGIGKQVKSFSIGDKVFGETTLGFSTNAAYVTVPESGVILPLPENMSYTEAAPVCDGALTSINFLKEIGKIKAGQKVLINGASGSLGTAAVQLAHYFGAEVTAVCSAANFGLVKSLGADKVIDYKKQSISEINDSFDIVYDTVGKSSFVQAKKVLKKGGIYISPVLKFSLLIQMIWTSFIGAKKAKFGASGLKSDSELRSLVLELIDIYKAGKLKTVIDRQFPLEKLAMAHKYIAAGHKKGNVVIVVEH